MGEISATGHARLVLITGPIASGKTTVAVGLAALMRHQGHRAAAIDMDDLVEVIAGADWSAVQPEHRQQATELASTIAGWLFDAGYSLVAVAGSTLSWYERDALTKRFPGVPATFVFLRVSLAESIRRAQADPLRAGTKNADFVRRIYDVIDWANLPPADVDLHADALDADALFRLVANKVLVAGA
jgi:adenylylsulfate kinase-like enzyme